MDDVLDPRRQGTLRDDEAVFGRNNRMMTQNNDVVKDRWSRGVKTDKAAERDFPYKCKHCDRRFLAATQCSDHLLEAHGERLHASLIRPSKARGLAEDVEEEAEED